MPTIPLSEFWSATYAIDLLGTERQGKTEYEGPVAEDGRPRDGVAVLVYEFRYIGEFHGIE